MNRSMIATTVKDKILFLEDIKNVTLCSQRLSLIHFNKLTIINCTLIKSVFNQLQHVLSLSV